MILAAIDGQLIVLLLMAVFGIISWLSGKLNPGEKKTPPQTPAPPEAAPRRRAAGESEEERMRRFLDALGLPSSEMPSPPTVAPPPFAPRPKPPVVQAPPPLPVRPRVEARPRPVPTERSLDELETTSLPVEQIALPELVTPPSHDFETVSSRISATHERLAPARETAPQPAAPIHELLRAAMASPQQLRSAIVFREILGPPLGLRG